VKWAGRVNAHVGGRHLDNGGEEIHGMSQGLFNDVQRILSPRDGLCNLRGEIDAERREEEELSRVEVGYHYEIEDSSKISMNGFGLVLPRVDQN